MNYKSSFYFELLMVTEELTSNHVSNLKKKMNKSQFSDEPLNSRYPKFTKTQCGPEAGNPILIDTESDSLMWFPPASRQSYTQTIPE